MAKVLILAGDAAEDLETMYVKYRLVEAGHEPYVAAPTTRPIKLVVHDFEPDFDTYVEKPGRYVPRRHRVRRRRSGGLRGGRRSRAVARRSSSASIRRCARIVEHFFAEDKPVGHAVPRAAGARGARPLRGRRSSGFPPLAPDIELAGGEYVDGAAVVDGNMVSCRGWGDLAEWSRAFLDVLDRAAVPA